MDLYSVLQYVLFAAIVTLLVKPLGAYMERVFARKRTFLDRLCLPVERLIYRLTTVSRCLTLPLCSRDAFILQHPDHDAPVLGLALGRLIAFYLPAFAHCARRQHVSQWNMTLLLQKLSHFVGPVFAQLLIQRRIAHR